MRHRHSHWKIAARDLERRLAVEDLAQRERKASHEGQVTVEEAQVGVSVDHAAQEVLRLGGDAPLTTSVEIRKTVAVRGRATATILAPRGRSDREVEHHGLREQQQAEQNEYRGWAKQLRFSSPSVEIESNTVGSCQAIGW